jgi:hypothetical protein
MPGPEKDGGDPPSNGAPSSTLATAPATTPPQPPARRGSLSAAVQGRRSAQQALKPAPEQQSRDPSDDQPRQPAQNHEEVLPDEPDSVPHQGTEGAKAPHAKSPPGAGPRIAASAATTAGQRSAEESIDATTVLTGSGDAVVQLTKNAPGPAVVYIWGNAARKYFSIRTIRTDKVLVNTMEPYDGAPSLDWDGEESTGFEIRATGSWRIQMLPLSAIPTFTSNFNGNGNMVVHFTGSRSLVEITGNNEGLHFQVRALGALGARSRLVDTTRPYAGSCQISRGPQLFEIQATGPWTITIQMMHKSPLAGLHP